MQSADTSIRLGCGTMGLAVLDGVLDSLESRDLRVSSMGAEGSKRKYEQHAEGTVTPINVPEDYLPSKFFACVNRKERVEDLQKTFLEKGGRRGEVKVLAKQNIHAVRESDVILLGYVRDYYMTKRFL